ncbi:transposase [Streptomyces inhibens]|uniref:transposase n=1 Tax=Streptomyces inhibens TaxID=2293571 RepID=UPI0037A8F6C4
MAPDELWELFRRVVPEPPSRPRGGGRRRYGDREVLAAIIFVATSGCTWRQLPPSCGPSGPTAHRRSMRRRKFPTVAAGKGGDSFSWLTWGCSGRRSPRGRPVAPATLRASWPRGCPSGLPSCLKGRATSQRSVRWPRAAAGTWQPKESASCRWAVR